jgi:hypothetical protein
MQAPTLDPKLIAKLHAQGIVNAEETLKARTVAKLGLPVAAALEMVESGGQMIFGHDSDRLGKCPGWGWGQVTKENYLAFRHLRDTQGRSNGVGLTQLTSPSLQDQADAAGGCWIPQHNLAVGFHTLHDLIVRYGLIDGCAAYNGGPGGRHNAGPQTYAHHLVALAEHYKEVGVGTVVGVLA